MVKLASYSTLSSKFNYCFSGVPDGYPDGDLWLCFEKYLTSFLKNRNCFQLCCFFWLFSLATAGWNGSIQRKNIVRSFSWKHGDPSLQIYCEMPQPVSLFKPFLSTSSLQNTLLFGFFHNFWTLQSRDLGFYIKFDVILFEKSEFFDVFVRYVLSDWLHAMLGRLLAAVELYVVTTAIFFKLPANISYSHVLLPTSTKRYLHTQFQIQIFKVCFQLFLWQVTIGSLSMILWEKSVLHCS